MKNYLLIGFYVLSFSLFGNIQDVILSTKTDEVYLHEYCEIDIEIIGASHKSDIELVITSEDNEIVVKEQNKQYSFVDNTINNIRYTTVDLQQRIVPLTTGDIALNVKVIDKTCEPHTVIEKTLNLKVHGKPLRNSPENFITYRINNTVFYVDEEIQLFYEVFSKDTCISTRKDFLKIDNINYGNAIGNRYINLDPVDSYARDLIQITSLPTALITYTHPGEYNIPALTGTFDFLDSNHNIYQSELSCPEIPIKIIERPKVENELFIGKDFGIKKFELINEPNSFIISISGTGNLKDIESLQGYFSIGNNFIEHKLGYYKTLENGHIISLIEFKYTDINNEQYSTQLPTIKIPIFDTQVGATRYIKFIPGKNRKIFYILIIIISSVIIALIAYGSISIFKGNRINNMEHSHKKEISIEFEKRFNFTNREKEVLKLLLEGKSPVQISELLFISPETAKKHINNIYKKSNVHSRYELMDKFNPHLKKDL